MKKLLVLVLLLAAGGAYLFLREPAEPPFVLEEGYRYLYDGESLQGWRVIGGESTFAAEGESIVGRHGPGENTFLRTEATFADFNLRMQMRWDELGNSGVLFRAQQRGGDGRAYGYQYELDHSDRAWSAGIYDEARRGWLYNLENNAEARAAVRLDDWNEVEIEARGSHLKTWINGVPAAEVFDGLDAEGFIALQVHSGNVGVMRWRHIRIKELPPLAQPGESLGSEVEWRMDNLDALAFDGANVNGALPEGDFWLYPRRQFKDVRVAFSVPACEEPTTIQMRFREDSTGLGPAFAEVKIFADRAEGRLVTQAGEQVMEPAGLKEGNRHLFTGVTVGDAVTLTVDEKDALRLLNTGLYERGQMRIQPARCGEDFTLANMAWYDLRERSPEPLFYETLDNEPAPVLSPEEAQQAFSVAPGFVVELVAAEPLVEDPVAMAWDEFGRVYVVEMRGYMPDAYGTGADEPVGQVVRLTDDDGDGRMDRSEVFLDQLVNPRAVAVVNEGVLIGEPPNLWLCELPSRDSLCENRRSLGVYGADPGSANVEHMENRLLQGLDNWLYNSKSARSLRIENGELVERDGLYRGQWGISKDDQGRLFYNHNSTWVQADLFAGEDLVVPGVDTELEGLGVNLTESAEVFSVRVNPGVNRAYLDDTLREDGRLHKATGVSGLVNYRGHQFPERFHGHVFVPESAGNVVAQFALSEEGLELQAEQQLYADDKWGQRDFLGSTDERFRPVDTMNGPDGALYVIDMYRGIIQDVHFLTDELREQIFQRQLEKPIGMGRIWRLRHRDGLAGRDYPVLGDADNVELVAALSHPNGWVRDTAQRLLLARGGDLTGSLTQLATAQDSIPALHALWTLAGRDELSQELVMQVARGGDTIRQVNALRAGRHLLTAADVMALGAELENAGPALQVQLALLMGDHAARPNVRRQLAGLLNRGLEDAFLRQAVLRALHGQELSFLQEYFAAGDLPADSETARSAFAALAANSYRSLRPDFSSEEAASPELNELLGLVESRRDEQAWQQVAMLKGFAAVALSENFQPAQMAAAPPIFADSSISEKDPLWNARLGGRVAFTWPGDELAQGMKPLSPEQLALMVKGEAFYPQCAACHGLKGGGTDGLAPALAGVSWVTGPPEWLGRIILQGMNGPVEVNGETWDGVMPPHGHLGELDDATLAGLMTYLRRSWGNKADPVSVEQVAAIRAASAERDLPWTVADLEAVPFDRGYSRYVGKYSVSFITMTVSEQPEGLHLSVPMYGGGVMEQLSDTIFYGAAGGERVKVEFVIEEDGSVNQFLLHREGEKIPVRRKAN